MVQIRSDTYSTVVSGSTSDTVDTYRTSRAADAAVEREAGEAAAAADEAAAQLKELEIDSAKKAGDVQSMGFSTLKAYLVEQGFSEDAVKACSSMPQLLQLHEKRPP